MSWSSSVDPDNNLRRMYPFGATDRFFAGFTEGGSLALAVWMLVPLGFIVMMLGIGVKILIFGDTDKPGVYCVEDETAPATVRLSDGIMVPPSYWSDDHTPCDPSKDYSR